MLFILVYIILVLLVDFINRSIWIKLIFLVNDIVIFLILHILLLPIQDISCIFTWESDFPDSNIEFIFWILNLIKGMNIFLHLHKYHSKVHKLIIDTLLYTIIFIVVIYKFDNFDLSLSLIVYICINILVFILCPDTNFIFLQMQFYNSIIVHILQTYLITLSTTRTIFCAIMYIITVISNIIITGVNPYNIDNFIYYYWFYYVANKLAN